MTLLINVIIVDFVSLISVGLSNMAISVNDLNWLNVDLLIINTFYLGFSFFLYLF